MASWTCFNTWGLPVIIKALFPDPDDEDDDLDEPDGKQIENDYEFPPQFKTNVEQLESERYSTY